MQSEVSFAIAAGGWAMARQWFDRGLANRSLTSKLLLKNESPSLIEFIVASPADASRRG
jgi:hypothetical protein